MEPLAILRDVTRGPLRAATLEDLAARWRAGSDASALRERAGRELGAVTPAEFERWVTSLSDAKDSGTRAAAEILGSPAATVAAEDVPWGHPVATLRAEAEAIESHMLTLEAWLAGVNANPEDWERWAALTEPLLHVESHFAKKEHQWFPVLEERGIVRPSLVMWQADDRVRNLLSQLRGALDRSGAADAVAASSELTAALRRVLTAELTVLVPLAVEALGDDDWARVRRGEQAYGYCLIADPPDWPPHDAHAEAGRSADDTSPFVSTRGVVRDALPMGSIALTHGGLTIEQALGVLAALPVDLTFVDHEDRVRFFNRTARPVFRRSAGAIGREVRYCHPPKSVHMVLEIVEQFRAGKHDVAEFWFTGKTGLVHIRYFALRDEDGSYAGVLEVSQDIGVLREAGVGPLDLPLELAAPAREDARRPARAVAPPGSLLMDEGLLTARQLDLILGHLPLAVGVFTEAAGWHFLNRGDIPLVCDLADGAGVRERLLAGRDERIVESPTGGRAWTCVASLVGTHGDPEGAVAMTQWLEPLERLEGERRILDWRAA